MTNTEATEKYYLISHLTMFTGLSDRTIRNHISAGFLKGEKINGLWHFSPEQVDAFIKHPSVWPGILAKKNAMVYDFLLEEKRTIPETCAILDLPGADPKHTAEFFCYTISNGTYQNIRFSFDAHGQTCRVILKGDTGAVLELLNRYYGR